MASDEQYRRDPDALLAAIKRDEAQQQRGKLKIFFGMAAGVGKTFAMLQAAHELTNRGMHVVIGYVETHGRAETKALLEGLILIPRKKMFYRNVELEEMDLDAILELKPKYVLVDELAHSNVVGSRHVKRYQDVLELIDHGINVYTTLNVQHVESLVDTVNQITNITIHETVPDSVIDAADEIELVDLPPDELLKRFEEGKVYTPEKSKFAMQNFFRQGNLTALREISLRKTAERVDKQLQDYMQINRIQGPWRTVERLMVAIGTSPNSEKLLRWTRRVASSMEAPWIAVYVQTSGSMQNNPADEDVLKKNIALARHLGAEVITTSDEDVVKALIRVAHQKNVTQIVVGKSFTNPFFNLFRKGSLVNRLIHASGDIDVYVVSGERSKKYHQKKTRINFTSPIQQYISACGTVFLVSYVLSFTTGIIDYRSVGIFLLFTISVLALFVGRGPVLVAAAFSAIVWNVFFIPPLYTLSINSFSDVLMLILYFLIALVGGTLTTRIRAREMTVRHREEHTNALYALTKEINNAASIDDIVHIAILHITQLYKARVILYLLDESNTTNQLSAHSQSTLVTDSAKELRVAIWVSKNRKPAGKFTDTLPSSDATYFPLQTNNGIVGVIGIATDSGHALTFDQEALLQTSLHQISIAIERESLRKKAEQTKMIAESERLYKTLLNSISHELRTPLATITGASSSLLDSKTAENTLARTTLIGDIYSSAILLNRLVENLLDMTRLESGLLKLNLSWCDISDLIHVVMTNLKNELSFHDVEINIASDIRLVKLDFVLIEQAITNVLLNAALYTPTGTTIRISSYTEQDMLNIIIEDEGRGFPPESLDHIFDKFYRAPGSKSGGTGLGLSIVRGFVEAHGGKITAENRMQGGARLTMKIPTATLPNQIQET